MKNNHNYRVATPLFLWGLAVSAVIVGEFAGWNEGLVHGGFGGMLVATILAALMFGCLSATCSELTTAMPFSGGAFAYSRAAFNPVIAFITGISQLIAYVATLATVLASIQLTTHNLFLEFYGIHIPAFGAWVFYTAIFALLNVWDARMFYRSALFLSLLSLGALAYFFLKAAPLFDINLLLNIPFSDGGTKWLPKGIIGVAWCLPFAVWFFVVIEIITLSPEDSANIETHIPKAFYASFATILLVSFLVLFLASGVGKGAADIAIKNNAYQYALAFVTDNQLPSFIFILLILTGPLAGFHSTIFAASRVSYSLGRAGYLPQGLASMSEKRQTPHSAIIFTSLLALVILVVTNLFAEGLKSIATLLNMAILGAIISYTMTFTSYVVLSVNYPKMKRPYVSPLGVTGAVAGLIISGITTALMFTNPEFLLALGVCVLVICIGLIYYFTIGKKNIKVDEPEEAFSINLHSHHHMGE